MMVSFVGTRIVERNSVITYYRGITIICPQYLKDLHSLDDHPRYKKGTNDKK